MLNGLTQGSRAVLLSYYAHSIWLKFQCSLKTRPLNVVVVCMNPMCSETGHQLYLRRMCKLLVGVIVGMYV